MKTKFFLGLLSLVLLITSCKKESALSYKNSIPTNASFVVSVNLMNLIEKGNLRDLMKEKEINNVTEGLDAELSALLKEIWVNPQKSGIDMKEPLFVFSVMDTSEVSLAKIDLTLLAKVDKKENLEHLFKVIEKKVGELKESKSISYLLIPGVAMFAFDDTRFVVRAGAFKNEEVELADIEQLFSLEAEGSLMNNVDFAMFMSQAKDIDYWVSSHQYIAFLSKNAGIAPNLQLKMGDIDYGKMNMAFHLDFQKGAIQLITNVYSDDKEMMKMVETFQKEFSGKLTGEYLKNIPAKSYFSLAFHLQNSQKMVEMVRNMDLFKAMSRQLPMDVIDPLFSIFSGIDGECVFSLSNVSLLNSASPISAALFMQVKDESAWNQIKALLGNQISLTEIKEGVYDLAGYAKVVQKEKELIICSNDIYANLEKGFDSSMEKERYASVFKNNQSAVVVDFQAISTNPMLLSQILKLPVNPFAIIDYFEITSNNCDSQATLYLTNKEENALATLSSLIFTLANK